MAATRYHEGKFPPAKLDWERLIPLIGPANAAVARYEGVLHGIPNAQVLLSPLTSQEAVLSSKIEGTQATLGEVLEFEAAAESATGEKRDDIQEVLNYRQAMRHAVEAMKKLPLSQRVVRDAHRVLMHGVRGENKTPEDYRRIPNWIGPAGCKVEQVRFVPPGADRVPELMSAWEKCLNGEAPDKLVQLALLHADSKRSTRSSMATGVWGDCSCHCSSWTSNCSAARTSTSARTWRLGAINTTSAFWRSRATATGPAGAFSFLRH
ncbi:MAG: hypothetical protein AMXMBFR22_06800 [Phycisphaerae bacterium]